MKVTLLCVSSLLLLCGVVLTHGSKVPDNKITTQGKWTKKNKLFSASNTDVIITTYPVGQGDATMIRCPDKYENQVSLIDAGSWPHKTDVLRKDEYIDKIMEHYYNGNLKHIFLTHPHVDHVNYLIEQHNPSRPYNYTGVLARIAANMSNSDELMDENKITIHISTKTTWNWKRNNPWAGSYEWLTGWLNYTNPRKVFKLEEHPQDGRNNMIDICRTPENTGTKIWINILKSDAGNSVNIQIPMNEKSMVMMLHNNEAGEDRKMLFLGDLENSRAFQELYHVTNEEELQADVVMVPHHGSRTTKDGNKEFFDRVKAKLHIISSHILGQFHHPRTSTFSAICGNTARSYMYRDNCGWNDYTMNIDRMLCDFSIKVYQTTNLNFDGTKLIAKNIETTLRSIGGATIREEIFRTTDITKMNY